MKDKLDPGANQMESMFVDSYIATRDRDPVIALLFGAASRQVMKWQKPRDFFAASNRSRRLEFLFTPVMVCFDVSI